MNKLKLYLVILFFLITTLIHGSQVIPPNYILLNIAKNNASIENLASHWAIKNSDFSKKYTHEKFLAKLKLLSNIDYKSINLNSQDTVQSVKTKTGQKLEITFKYTKYDYGPDDIALSGAYSFVSVEKLESGIEDQ